MSRRELEIVQLLGRMMLFPVTVFVISMETLVRTWRQLDGAADPRPRDAFQPAPPAGATATFRDQVPLVAATPFKPKEEPVMDSNLSDDMVKLVRYTIVNIERDNEGIVKRGEEIVTDNMTDDAFSAWMVSKHVDDIDLPYRGEDPRKYLRVSWEVLSRWPKQDRKYEKRQLDVLGEIRDALRE